MATPQELEATIRRLEDRVRALEDIDAIEQLKARYAELVDFRYGRDGVKQRSELEPLAEQISLLFTEDAIWEGGKALGTCKGRSEIHERFLNPTLSFSWHYFLKPRIEVEGDHARGRWDLLAPCSTPDGEPHWMAGFEDDEYRKVKGEWLHSRMKLTLVFLAPYDQGWKRKRTVGRPPE